MHIAERNFTGAADKRRMADVVRASPAENLHVVDLPYRLASWALDDPANVALWEDESQRVVAWAVLQMPFWCLDYAWVPETPPDMHMRILAWADGRARHAGRPCWFVNVFARQQQRRRELEGAGFADQADVDENPWSKVLLRYDGGDTPPTQLPAGFTIRPLGGAAEVGAYVALHRAAFGSDSMTEPWRERTLAAPEYRPELDLVAVAPDARLAGFAVCWFADVGLDGRRSGQFEPVGVHPDFQGQGLGRALMAEGLRRLRAAGAEAVSVETDHQRGAALRLYTSVGFVVAEDVRVYRKELYGRRLLSRIILPRTAT
jgi:ribosomal protein S18 acetylase RimI-like enzyme